ncbi:LuxR C-terminal-related transcriptional regulator [Streptomyces sp. NPDC006134]|uniref:LuxR C-terminal-related transcriptional regulator n=1 Tax=Streptomyces sp. NPDC006134 TaxID=3154467 RepID=UPI0033FB0E14
MLEMLGLDAQSEAVYRIMLSRPELGVLELSRELDLSEADVRAALDRLADLTLVRQSRDRPGGLRVLGPELALEVMLRKKEQEVLAQQQRLAAAKLAAAQAIAELGTRDGETPGADVLLGLDSIHERLELLTKDLRDECLAVMPGGAQSQASLDASRPLDEEALDRGVDLLTLYQDSMRNDMVTLAYARWMTEAGGQVRTAPVLPPRFLVFDREVALVPIDPANTRRGALCTREPAVVATLCALFFQVWESAVPLGTRQTAGGISTSERQLLKLLASGLTDDAAAKRLGVSLRTVRRQMSSLMEKLDARSRFEAGLKAAKLGWL